MAQRNLYNKQKRIKVQKIGIKEGDYFLRQNTKAIEQALFKLRSAAGFKLYIYLAMINTEKDSWWHLSSKSCCESCGISRTAYTTAIGELIREGYLKPLDDLNQDYLFQDYIEE